MNPFGFFSEFGRVCRVYELFFILLFAAFCTGKGFPLGWDAHPLTLAAAFVPTLLAGLCSLVASFQKGSPQQECRLVQIPASLVELGTASFALCTRLLMPDTPHAHDLFSLASTLWCVGVTLVFLLTGGHLFWRAWQLDRHTPAPPADEEAGCPRP